MTTLELFKKHRNGEVSRERFLYEVRRDNNLPWITNVTSYNDAVKILKNKGIIREAQFEPQNIPTDPAVDRANPYAVKREVQNLLSKEKELTNDSYKLALNKAAKKIAGNPQAIKDAMFSNADSVAKADSKLQTKEVKKNNFVDKDNGMKKVKGQETLKAQSAPTKENRKGKPKGVKVMPDKGVEGSQKIIKEISEFIKKKLTENSSYSGFHEGMVVPTRHGEGTIENIVGGTLEVRCEDGKLYDVQMNVVSELIKRAKEQPKQEAIDVKNLGGYEKGMRLADKLIDAINMYNDLNPEQRQAEIDRLKTDIPVQLKAKFDELMDALHDETNYPDQGGDTYLNEADDDISSEGDPANEYSHEIKPNDTVEVQPTHRLQGLQGTVISIEDNIIKVRFTPEDVRAIGLDHTKEKNTKQEFNSKQLAKINEEYGASGDLKTEDVLQEDLKKIQSYIATSSVLDIGFKQYALESLEAVDSYIEEQDFEEAIMELKELRDALQQVLGRSNPDTEFFDTDKTLGKPKDKDFDEFNDVYAPLFDKVISTLQVLADQKENEEELDEFTTAKTNDSKHNADIKNRINRVVTNPDAKKQLTQDFEAGKTIDL